MTRRTAPASAPQPTAIALAVASAFAFCGTAHALPTGEQVIAGQVSVQRPSAGAMTIQQGSAAGIVNWSGFSIANGELVRIQQPGVSSVLLNRVVGSRASEIFGQLSANGTVFLLNPNGVLFAPGSQVDVGSLVASTLSITNDDFLAGRYRFAGSGGAVVNDGTITAADRGTVALLGGTVSNGGRIEARLGTVALAAGSRMTLDLAGDGLSGLAVTQAAIDAQVANGGAIVADGGAVLLTAHALNTLVGNTVNQTGIVRARSLVERDGRIVLDGGDGGTAMVSGTLDATGAAGTHGGAIEVLGQHVGLTGTAVLDASGDRGGGTVLVGGDYQGGNAAVPNAATTTVAAGVSLSADATGRGDGGKVVVWSDDATRVDGAITARGGPLGGDGGLVETSGHRLLADGARVDASATIGKAGTWLLDPVDVTIDQTAANGFSGTLSSGTNVTVSTTGLNDLQGNITVLAGTSIAKTAGADARLTFSADNNILIDPAVTISSTAGRLNFDLNADKDNSGSGGVAIVGAAGRPVQIATNGGDFRIYGGADPVAGRASYAINVSSGGPSSGVTLYQTSVATTGTAGDGSISIRGRGADALQGGFASSGVTLWQSSLASGSGDIVVDGLAGHGSAQVFTGTTSVVTDPVGIGSLVLGTSIGTTSGAVTITGVGADATTSAAGRGGEGINMRATTVGGTPGVISTGSGAITLVGTGGHAGSGTGATEAGGIGGRGVNFSSVEVADGISTVSGQISLNGTGGGGGNGYTDGSDAAGGIGATGVLVGRVTVSGAGGLAVVGTGGAGGAGGSGGAGAVGGAGIEFPGTPTGSQPSRISLVGTGGGGGRGDVGGAGGAGGAGVDLFRSILSGTVAASSMTVSGRGGDGGTSEARGAGGAGGNGVLVRNDLAVGAGTMSITGSGGAGGNGGAGFDGLDGSDAPVGTSAAGGSGESGEAAGAAGGGGNGILVSGGSLTSAGGAIQLVGSGGLGGSGGAGGFGGSGGAGGNLTGAGGAAGAGGGGGAGASGGIGVAFQGSSVNAPGSLSTVGTGGTGGIGGAGGTGGSGGTGSPGAIGGQGGSGGGGGSGGDGVAVSAASTVTSGSVAIVGSGGVGADGGLGGAGGNGGASVISPSSGGDGGRGGAGGSPDHGGSGVRFTASTISAMGALLSMTGTGAATGNPGVGGAGGNGASGGDAFESGAGGAGGNGGDGGFSFGLSGGADGIDIVSSSALSAAGGSIALTGRSGTGAGAATAGAGGAAGAGGVPFGPSGAAGNIPDVSAAQLGGDGMRLISATLTAANVRLTGLAENVAPSTDQRGVSGIVSGGTTVTASQAADIRGLGSAGSGVDFGFSDVITSGTGALWITGDTTAVNAPGLSVGPATVGGSGQTANIVLRARNGGGSDSIALYSSGDGISVGSVRTAGTLVLAPGGLSSDASTIVAANAVPITVGAQGTGFALDATDFSAIDPRTGTVLLGSDTHTGAIQASALGTVPFNLTLQNEGSGSSGIVLSNGLAAPGHTLTLATSGALASGGAIVANALQVRGGAGTAAVLTNPGNAVNTLAVDPPASFSFVNNGPVRLGPVTGGSFTSSTGVAGTTTVTNSASLGDFTVQTLAGAITLNQNIAASSPGSNITLAAATVFDAASGVTLTPGPGGRWRVYADTWGDLPSRGGLVATSPNPNFYGCAYGAASCASGVSIPVAGNHFIYVQRPTATVTAADQSRAYGSANPTPAFRPTTDLVNDDTAADAFTGSLQQTAPANAPVGQYPIIASATLTSPVGYNLSFVAGRLDVTAATLTIRANNQSRLYGGANPNPTRTVTGLIPGDTESVISGGIPLQTAVDRSPVGSYAIPVGAASASNYTITSVPGVLRIDPASLTITANSQSRLYGDANPAATRTVSGLVLGETDAVISGGIPFQTAVDRSPVGSYAIPVGAASASNYTITNLPGVLTIDPAPLTIIANNQSRLYGGTNPVATRTVVGLVLGETDSVVSGGIPQQTAVERSNVGSYPIVVSDASAGNYRITTVPGALSVTPAPLTVAADDQRRLEGMANPPLTATVSGLVAGDTPAIAAAAGLRLTTPADASSSPGNYVIAPSGFRLANYDVTELNGTLTVLGSGRFENPTRDLLLLSSDLYERNRGVPAICTPSDPTAIDRAAPGADILSIEWTRVRQKPNVSNCLDLGQRNGCSDF